MARDDIVLALQLMIQDAICLEAAKEIIEWRTQNPDILPTDDNSDYPWSAGDTIRAFLDWYKIRVGRPSSPRYDECIMHFLIETVASNISEISSEAVLAFIDEGDAEYAALMEQARRFLMKRNT